LVHFVFLCKKFPILKKQHLTTPKYQKITQNQRSTINQKFISIFTCFAKSQKLTIINLSLVYSSQKNSPSYHKTFPSLLNKRGSKSRIGEKTINCAGRPFSLVCLRLAVSPSIVCLFLFGGSFSWKLFVCSSLIKLGRFG
jgi:hypothetical protein